MAGPGAYDLNFEFDNAFGTSSAGGGLGIPANISALLQETSNPMEIGQFNLPGMTKLPGMGGPQAGYNRSPFVDKAALGIAGLQTIGSLWAAFQANKLAKQQFKMTKKVTEANLANSIKSYNTTLEDRARSRAAVENQSADQQQSYVDKNRLPNYMG